MGFQEAFFGKTPPGAIFDTEEGGAIAADAPAVRQAGRVGPNAILQVIAALKEKATPEESARVFAAAGLSSYLESPPSQMVPEAEVGHLHKALREELDPGLCTAVALRAGETTADYLLANRIPDLVKKILDPLPPAVAAPILLVAISKNAWTFVGSGAMFYSLKRPITITVTGSPLCRDITGAGGPVCAYYVGTFQGLFRALVADTARVEEIACAAAGAPACVFEITW